MERINSRTIQIGDRISAKHVHGTAYCDTLHRSEVHGYVHDIGTYVVYVVDAEDLVIIHTRAGWNITIHPEVITKE